MNRNEKIHKLANAVREFRGQYNPRSKKWVQPPNPAKEARVIFWLAKLDRPVAADMERIKRFQTIPEFDGWIKELADGLLSGTGIEGMKFLADDSLPPGVIEFRHPVTGKVLGRMEDIV